MAEKPSSGWVNVRHRKPSANYRSAPPPSSCSASSDNCRKPFADSKSEKPPSSCSAASVDFRQTSANPRSAPPPPSCSASSVDFGQPSANPRSASPSSWRRRPSILAAAYADLEMARKSMVQARDALTVAIPKSANGVELEKEKQAVDKECDAWMALMAEWENEFMVYDEDASETQSTTQNAWRCGEIFLICGSGVVCVCLSVVLLLICGSVSVYLLFCC